MLASPPSPRPRKRSPALEAMLSNLEATEDLLSGSECSSLAASPVEEKSSFRFAPRSSETQHWKSKIEVSEREPIAVLKDFLDHMGEADAAKKLISDDATVECCSLLNSEDEKDATPSVQRNLDGLQASCSAYRLQIDSIFDVDGDVAAFGHFAYSACPLGLPRNVHFSIWAKVDVETARIVRFKWLDQIVRAEDSRADDLERDILGTRPKETESMRL